MPRDLGIADRLRANGLAAVEDLADSHTTLANTVANHVAAEMKEAE